MTASETSLAALIGSRICHDLISPIGAINNGIELLGMSDAKLGDGPEMALISESCENASARIRFFRVAYGAAGRQTMGAPEVVSILRDLFTHSRLRVNWTPTEGHPRSSVRLAFLALQCLETAMPFGGQIEITEQNGKWRAHGTADKLNIDPDIWALLASRRIPDDLRPAFVQFALLPIIAADESRRLLAQSDETTVKISF